MPEIAMSKEEKDAKIKDFLEVPTVTVSNTVFALVQKIERMEKAMKGKEQ